MKLELNDHKCDKKIFLMVYEMEIVFQKQNITKQYILIFFYKYVSIGTLKKHTMKKIDFCTFFLKEIKNISQMKLEILPLIETRTGNHGKREI